MADDENDKDNKKDDAQVKNELNAIKAQVTSTNDPAKLTTTYYPVNDNTVNAGGKHHDFHFSCDIL